VGQLGVDVVVDIPLIDKPQSDTEFRRCSRGGKTYHILQGSRTTESEVLKLGQEVLGPLGLLLEFVRVVDLLNMFLESL